MPHLGHAIVFQPWPGAPVWSYRGYRDDRGWITAGGFPTQLDAIAHLSQLHRFDTWEVI